MAKDSLIKASTPQPFSTSTTSNWVARTGGLPDYIQHIAHGIMRSQKVKDESKAIQEAIGVCKNPPADWDANAKAACAKAITEWESKKAATHAKAGVKEAVHRALLDIREAKNDDDGSSSDETMPSVFCVKCRGKRKPTDKMKCPKCGTDLSKAVAQSRKVSEGVLEALGGSFEEAHPRGRGGQWVAKQGASGQAVSSIQAQVGTTVDGQYGNQTRQAVIAFQRKHGLQVDGKVGAQTVAAMRGQKNAAGVTPGGMTATDRAWLLKQLVKT